MKIIFVIIFVFVCFFSSDSVQRRDDERGASVSSPSRLQKAGQEDQSQENRFPLLCLHSGKGEQSQESCFLLLVFRKLGKRTRVKKTVFPSTVFTVEKVSSTRVKNTDFPSYVFPLKR